MYSTLTYGEGYRSYRLPLLIHSTPSLIAQHVRATNGWQTETVYWYTNKKIIYLNKIWNLGKKMSEQQRTWKREKDTKIPILDLGKVPEKNKTHSGTSFQIWGKVILSQIETWSSLSIIVWENGKCSFQKIMLCY